MMVNSLLALLLALAVGGTHGEDDYVENSRYTGTLSLLVDSTDVTLQYIYPHPENPQSVVHALFSKRYTKIQTKLVVAGGIVGDGTAFMLDDGCRTSQFANISTTGNVVLVVRGGCSFAVKAGNIAASGAVGMIVVDNCRQNSASCSTNVAPVMSLGNADVSDNVYGLVAVAVTESVGIQMLQLNMQDDHITVTIEKNFPDTTTDSTGNTVSYSWPDDDLYNGDVSGSKSMFGHFVLFSGCITMAMLGLMSFLQFRQNKRRARRRANLLRDILAQQELEAEAVFMLVPVTPYAIDPDVAVEDRDVCCICLDNFEDGDEVRSLPCKHVLHKDCIDPWLETHVTCPMCKDDIYVAVGVHDPPPPEEAANEDAGGGDDNDDNDDDDDEQQPQVALDQIVVVPNVLETSIDGSGNNNSSNSNSGGGGGGGTAADVDAVSNESASGFGDQSDDDEVDSRWSSSALDTAARRSVSTPAATQAPCSDTGSNDSLERIPLARPTYLPTYRHSRSALNGAGSDDDEVGSTDEYISVTGESVDNTIPGQVSRTAL